MSTITSSFESILGGQCTVELHGLRCIELEAGSRPPSTIVNADHEVVLALDVHIRGSLALSLVPLGIPVRVQFFVERLGAGDSPSPTIPGIEFITVGGRQSYPNQQAIVPAGFLESNSIYRILATLRFGHESTPLGHGYIEGLILNTLPTSLETHPLRRNFRFAPVPLFAPSSPWNQSVTQANVLRKSEDQIKATYRLLLGNTSTRLDLRDANGQVLLDENGEPIPWPFTPDWPAMHPNYVAFAIPIAEAKPGEQTVILRDYTGTEGNTSLKWPAPRGGQVSLPVVPRGLVRPSPAKKDEDPLGADGHLILYDRSTSTSYDFWQATTLRDREGKSQGGGFPENIILEAGMLDYFNINSSGVNVKGSASARATGTPLLAGLLLPEDIERGVISHALAFAVPGLRDEESTPPGGEKTYYYPASETERSYRIKDEHALAAGQRLRLRQIIYDWNDGNIIDEETLAPITRMFLAALRTYGAYVVDGASGFVFYAEDIHTAVLNVSNARVNELIGASPNTPLQRDKTKWQIVMEKLHTELDRIPIAYGRWPSKTGRVEDAEVTHYNFDVVDPAPAPILKLSETSHEFGTSTNPWTFAITNDGAVGTGLDFYIRHVPNWIQVSPAFGFNVGTTTSTRVVANLMPGNLTDGFNEAIIDIYSTGGNSQISVTAYRREL